MIETLFRTYFSFSNVILVLITISIVRFLSNFIKHWSENGLPGPYGLPGIGYIPFMTRRPHLKFLELAKTYGDIFIINVGVQKIVVVNGYEAIHEALNKDLAFAGRPQLPSFEAFAETGKSRFQLKQANIQWKLLRKNAVKALSMFATARNSKLEAVVKEANESLRNDFDQHIGRPFDPQKPIFDTVAGVIGSVLFGFKFDREDPLLGEVLKLTDYIIQFVEIGSIMDNVPFAKYIFKWKIDRFKQQIKPVNEMTEKQILAHDCNTDNITDVADALHKAAMELTDDEISEYNIGRNAIKFIAQDLFSAGFSTTMESFRWLLNLLSIHTDIQEKAFSEIDRVIGDREVSLHDRNDLVYCEAVVHEAFRWVTLFPLCIPHGMMEDTVFRGFKVPAGAVVLPNFWSVHMDPVRFPSPEIFNPERFVTTDKKFNNQLSQYIFPFSTGKRRCVGENLARQEIFLLFISTVQKYKFRIHEGEDPVKVLEAELGFQRRPKRCQLIFDKRAP